VEKEGGGGKKMTSPGFGKTTFEERRYISIDKHRIREKVHEGETTERGLRRMGGTIKISRADTTLCIWGKMI